MVKGYAIRKGNSIYKSSILGKSRKLMPSKIEATWVGLHASDKQTAIQSKEVCTQTMAHNNKEVMPQSKPSIYHYSITVDGEQLEVDIPDMVKSVFDEEFGSLDEEVKQTNLFKVAALLFAGYLDAATSMAASSGVKIRKMMSVTGLFVVQKWQNGSANRLNVAGVDSISFIITYNHA